MEVATLLGARIRALRSRQGLTQQSLGEKAGVNFKFLGAIERGEENPTIKVLGKIASALELTVSELLDFEHEKRDPAALRAEIVQELDAATIPELQAALRMIRALRR